MTRILLAGAAALACCAPAGAASLIANGGFETPGTTFLAFYNGGSTIGAWHVTGTDVIVHNTGYSETYGGATLTFNAYEGTSALDLTGSVNTGPLDGVYQDVATVAGRGYSLAFYVGNATLGASDGYGDASSVGLSINGAAQTVFTNAATTAGRINWARQTASFVATGATTRIAFLNATPRDAYAGLDAVTLQEAALPEPATWATALAGFGLAGGALRRRRTVAVA